MTPAEGWRGVSWGDLATLEYGKSLRGYQESEGPYRVYGTNGPIGWHSEALCPFPSVAIGRKGAYRGVHYSAEPFYVIDTAFFLKPKVELDIKWAYYQLLTQNINGMDSGSAIPSTSRDDFYSLPVDVPPLEEQRAIAHVLGTLDDRIELNRRMNETLEAMARALFRSWFVDYEPVRAKMEGRWRPGESLPGLPAHLHPLFPERLVPSELGDIPEGWEARTLGECFDLTMGQSPPGSTYNEKGDGLPFFQGRTDFGFRYPTNRKFCTAPTRMAEAGDTLVSVRAPVGDINMVWEQCCVGRGVAALRHKSGSSSYTYYALEALQPEIRQYEHTGTVFGAITKKQFEALQIGEPPEAVAFRFDRQALALDEQIREVSGQARILGALWDVLLPKLLSGEVRIPWKQ
ncbi:MAG: restriction endonuclease subunit S [Chloroflexota bacterium]|nr:restriction endonuclease subunit S [Chloroflexota bacterium]